MKTELICVRFKIKTRVFEKANITEKTHNDIWWDVRRKVGNQVYNQVYDARCRCMPKSTTGNNMKTKLICVRDKIRIRVFDKADIYVEIHSDIWWKVWWGIDNQVHYQIWSQLNGK